MSKTDAELKEMIVVKAPEILDKYLKIANGEMANTTVDYAAMTQVWNLVKDLVLKLDARENIAVKTTQDVITLLSKGKIDAKTALRLMELLKAQQEIEELPKLVNQLRDAGLIR